MTDPDAVLAALDPEQRAVATAVRGPVCVLAGAGTGKTRAITHRIAYAILAGVWQPTQVLAVTFTTRAAGQMRGRLRELGVAGVQARTFHSAALRQARYFWPRVYGGELPEIIESKLRFVAESAHRCRVDGDTASWRDLAGEIEWAKVSNVRPDDYAAVAGRVGRRLAGYDAATIARVFAAYEEVRRERERIDLEDVLLCAVALLADHSNVAETIRAQYRHFVVDEYQDVSPLQQTLLDLWLGGREEICVVGDVSQTIYSFAGASPAYLVGFPHRYPNAEIVRLVRDYRSTPQVVRVANAVFANAPAKERGSQVVLQAECPDGPPPRFVEYPDEVAEAEGVAQAIELLSAEGIPYRDIGVLFRVNAQSQSFEQALADRGIPYLVRGAERFFDRNEVRQAIVLLRGAARAGGSADGPDDDLVTQVRAVLSSTGWSPQPPTGTGAVRERWESLASLAGLAEDVARDRPDADLGAFVAVVEERAAAQHAPTADGVTLATLHAAKGLEWEAVFLAGVTDGTLPITYAETPEQVEEERRLFYVGVTRAKSRLSISWALARTPGARGRRTPSRFLDGIQPGVATGGGGRRGTTQAARSVPRCRTCGQPLRDAAERKLGRCAGCPSTFDEDLFERLRSWRLERAKEDSVPAFVVFTDATLTAIAESRPQDQRALANVPGVGTVKLERYGAEVLDLCAREG